MNIGTENEIGTGIYILKVDGNDNALLIGGPFKGEVGEQILKSVHDQAGCDYFNAATTAACETDPESVTHRFAVAKLPTDRHFGLLNGRIEELVAALEAGVGHQATRGEEVSPHQHEVPKQPLGFGN